MDVVTIGESMAVFTPASGGLMRQAVTFTRRIGGAESNVAVGLARLGHRVGWISKVGDDEFGKAILSFLQGEGVDVSRTKIDPEAPTGLYFKEKRRPNDTRVYYYRSGSAASRLTPADLDEKYLAAAKYLHITGITPALSESCRETIFAAIAIARRCGVKIVFDPNLRLKLWSQADEAKEVLLRIAAQADIVLPGAAEAAFLFGDRPVEKWGKQLLDSGSSLVVIKLGASGAHYFTATHNEYVPGFPVKHVVDPVGAGDGFAAGLLSGLLDGLSLAEAIRRANAVGALVTMVEGDADGMPERGDVERWINQQGEDVTR
ncbi:sugar kinase [Parageobacillus thermoglucosidasius]|uniref:sugar kinase n=2 Tax=Parageobacillus thermoglucosidasius TaxID=1426 RepID=UPI0001D190E2|nr:sugar kinase [Parageobacillus thermoglucosidasius]AEH48186.1 2-dehydro-3-deoxygluconokinase [Parageobacillus thermoglucosidasius C56-YS93]MBY6267621.1 sugar kinase [Parageobacillus thermoglucosidasius]RDE26927.1 sugar kinase [Parageobacillus thermoglucosidasius]